MTAKIKEPAAAGTATSSGVSALKTHTPVVFYAKSVELSRVNRDGR